VRLRRLANLQPQHIRLQGISQGVPQGAEGTNSTSWTFTILDAITQPVLGVADHIPEFQIAKAPPFMYVNNNSRESFSDLTFQQFAGYAKNLVQCYDGGGFVDSGGSLPVKNSDGSVVVMISNHSVASPNDNNGPGLTAKISLEVSALGSFASASMAMIDSTTSPGPSHSPISASLPISAILGGYSVAFIKLQ